MQQAFRLLRRVGFFARSILEPLAAHAQRDRPVRAHLLVVIEGFQGVIIEGDLGFLGLAGPDQGLVRILEAGALEVRHRVGFQPDDIVLDPEAGVLQDRADTEDVVIGTDHPDRAVGLEHAPAFGHPLMGEQVIGVEAVEPVPFIVHAVDMRLVRAGQPAAELEIVGRVGEDQVHAFIGQAREHVDAIAFDNGIAMDLHEVNSCLLVRMQLIRRIRIAICLNALLTPPRPAMRSRSRRHRLPRPPVSRPSL